MIIIIGVAIVVIIVVIIVTHSYINCYQYFLVTNSFLIVPLKLKTFHHKNKHHALCLSKSFQSVSYYFLL